MINRMPLIVQSACDSGRIALDRAHFSKKSKRNSTEGIYVYVGPRLRTPSVLAIEVNLP